MSQIGESKGLLWIEAPVWYAIQRAVNKEPKLEVMGMGHATIDRDGVICMDDIIIPPQEVSGASVHTSAEDFMSLWGQLVAEHGEKWTEWCVYWHSHCSMGTGPSNTDTTELANVVKNNIPFAVGLVVNIRGEHTAWAEVTSPFECSVDLDVLVDTPVYTEWNEKVDGWMAEVKQKSFVVTQTTGIKKGTPLAGGRMVPVSQDYMQHMMEGVYGLVETDDDEEQLERDDGSLAAKAGLVIPAGTLASMNKDALDRLARSIIQGEAEGQCDAEHDDVRCVMIRGHKGKVHCGLHQQGNGTLPAYFLRSGKPPKLGQIRQEKLPI